MLAQSFEILPLVGIGPVRLGMSREEVRQAMKGLSDVQPGRHSQEDDYLGRSFRVGFDNADVVNFIELSRGGLQAIYQGQDLFSLSAKKCARFLKAISPSAETGALGHTLTFPKLVLALWRPVVSLSSRDESGFYFMTVAIGSVGYFTT